MQKGSLKYLRNWGFPFVLLFLAAPVWAQPDPPAYFSFNLYFTLPSEMEAQFEHGNIDVKDFKIDCHYYYRGSSYPPSEEQRSIFFHKASFDAPAQISLSDWFLTFGGAREFDSIAVRFQWNEKKYATTVLPALHNASYGCICDFTNEYKRLAPNICKTHSIYASRRPDNQALDLIIEGLKNHKTTKQMNHISSTQILRIVNSDNETLFPLVIANGDTCDIFEGYGINAIVLPFPWENQKIQLEIFHPDYPCLKLDSVSRYGGLFDYVYLLKEDEAYYLDGGKRLPLEKGYKEQAFWFDPAINDQTLDSIVNVLILRNQLELTKDWRKIIKEEENNHGRSYVEFKYGGFDIHLKRVLHFKNNTDYEFNHNYNIADTFAEVIEVQIPVSFYKYLVPRLTIHFKQGLSEEEIENFEKDYLPRFERINFDHTQAENHLIQRTYQFPNWIFVPNYLQEVIMKDPRVSYCGDTVFEYILTE